MQCSFASCTFSQAISARRIVEIACRAPTDRSEATRFNIMNFALGVTTGAIAIVRLFFKLFLSSSKRFSPDDWVILATLIIGLPSIVVLTFGLTAKGLGRDVWALESTELAAFGLYFLISEVLYVALMALIKLALSLFYLAIFPGQGVRILLWATVAFLIMFGLAFVVKDVVQCSPPGYYWTRLGDDASAQGYCVNVNMSGWVNAAVGVAVDVWLLAIPLFQIRKLQLHWKKKILAAIMFMTGALVTLVSILRLHTLTTFANTTNPTWDQWSLVWWSTIEVNTGIICTCLPAVRLVLLRLYPRIFGTTSTSRASRASRATPNCAESDHGDREGSSHELKP
ncbi:Gag-pol polyprotein [Tolypocladium paradoxum]|uniref:Gag-pol polyprotein n=1 Tax=Tolypocladium paradoxum TaxID=94208 RepID=A0A2S4L2Q9_9HYPO|nr:Gag-pol polyprotein [Tolypocladium paradoxum]